MAEEDKVTSALPDDIREGIAVDNLKATAGQPANLANLAYMNAVHQQAMGVELSHAVMARCIDRVLDTRIDDAVAGQKLASGNDLGQQLAQLGSVIAQIQQSMKGAQTTPPPTP